MVDCIHGWFTPGVPLETFHDSLKSLIHDR